MSKISLQALIIISFLLFKVDSFSQGIAFHQGTLSSAYETAKLENKLVFVDCFTFWCKPCIWMEKMVFSDTTVAGYFSERFVSFQLDMESQEGIDFGSEKGVIAYPTFFFLDPWGKEVSKKIGVQKLMDFLEWAQSIYDPGIKLEISNNQYEAGLRDSLFLVNYSKDLFFSNKSNLEVGMELFKDYKSGEIINKRLWKLIGNVFSHPKLPPSIDFMSNQKGYSNVFGNLEAEEFKAKMYYYGLKDIIHSSNMDEYAWIKKDYLEKRIGKEEEFLELTRVFWSLKDKMYSDFDENVTKYLKRSKETPNWVLVDFGRMYNRFPIVSENERLILKGLKKSLDETADFSTLSIMALLSSKHEKNEAALILAKRARKKGLAEKRNVHQMDILIRKIILSDDN